MSALNTGIGDVSAGGNPITYQWPYHGPAINGDPSAPLATTPQAIQRVFDWFFANGGATRTLSFVDVPGVSTRIGDQLDSANVNELAFGAARQIADLASVRADFISRDYRDFYATRTDSTTGRATDSDGRVYDLGLVGGPSRPGVAR